MKDVPAFLKNYLIVVTILVAIVGIAVYISMQPKTFTVDAKTWDCTATEPDGIGARCTNLTMKKISFARQ